MTKWEKVKVISWNILGILHIIYGIYHLIHYENGLDIFLGILNIFVGIIIIFLWNKIRKIIIRTALSRAKIKIMMNEHTGTSTSFFRERTSYAAHTELNCIAELYEVRNKFHFWTTKKTKRRLIINAIQSSIPRQKKGDE